MTEPEATMPLLFGTTIDSAADTIPRKQKGPERALATPAQGFLGGGVG